MDRRSAKNVMLNTQEILKIVNGHLFADQTRSWMHMLYYLMYIYLGFSLYPISEKGMTLNPLSYKYFISLMK